MVLLICTAVGEGMFLLGTLLLPQGIFLVRGEPNLGDGTIFLLTVGIGLLALCATFGVMICSLLPFWLFRRELNTDQGLMLFLIPENSYAVLGAKVLEDLLVLAGSVLGYGLLAMLDVFLLTIRGAGSEMFSTYFAAHFYITESEGGGWTFLITAALVWLTILMVCFFGIVLQASLFRGNRGSFWIALLLVIVLAVVILRANSLIPGGAKSLFLLLNVGIAALLYFLCGRIMERHLSL